jgi:hypothetical protein
MTKCCLDASCIEAKSPQLWNCSNTYANPIVARYVCPFIHGHCGDHDQILLNKTGDKLTMKFSLPPRGVCMYQMRAKCGLPAFKPNITDDIDI